MAVSYSFGAVIYRFKIDSDLDIFLCNATQAMFISDCNDVLRIRL